MCVKCRRCCLRFGALNYLKQYKKSSLWKFNYFVSHCTFKFYLVKKEGISLMLCLWFSLFNGMESESLYNHIWFSSAIVVIFLFCLCDCHFTFCQRRLDHRHSLGGAGFARHRPSLVSASVGFGRFSNPGQPTLSARTEAIKQPQQTIPRKWWQNSWKMWVRQERF